MKADVRKALESKAAAVRTGAETLLAKTSDWQVIQQYMCGRLKGMKLTAEQQKKMDRYTFIYNALVSGRYTQPEVVQQLLHIHKIELTQAYEDIRCTRELWPSVINLNQQFEINVELDVTRRMLIKAEEMNDLKAWAAIHKNRVKLISMLPKPEDNAADDFEDYDIEATFNPSLLGAPPISKTEMLDLLNTINAKRGKKIKMDLFEDLEWEEQK